MKVDQCPVCLSVVTWDAKQFTKSGRRMVKLHKDGIGCYCPVSGKPFVIVDRAAVTP